MKYYSRILAFLLIFSLSFSASYAQKNSTVTEKITVQGICNMCKERIEEAAYVPGVKRAEWDKTSHQLTVTYKSDKVSLLKIEQSIAKTGHDAGDLKAANKDYQSLPNCCAYRDGAHCDH